jgi:hypothetical protein
MSESDDVVALWRLQSAYADVVTRRAWPELADLFRPDTAVHIDTVTAEPRTLVGPEAFGQFVAGAIDKYDLFLFVILNTIVDLDPDDPDSATGRFFMTEIRHEPNLRWSNAYGVYEDRYVRVDGRWWIAEHHYRSLARGGVGPRVFGIPPWLGAVDR